MQRKPWVFPALTFLLLANLLLGKQKLIGILLLCIWLIRIFLLRDQGILWQTLLLSSCFIVLIFIYQQRNDSKLVGTEQVFILALEPTSIKVDGDSLSFKGMVQQNNHEEKVVVRHYLKTADEKEKWLNFPVSSHLKIKGELIQPAGNTNFNQFNYQDYLKRNNVHWQLHAEEINWLENIKLPQPFFYRIDTFRYRILQYMDRVFHEKVSSYLKILFLADRSALTEETKESYRALGLIHLFSISGFHISYLAKAVQRLLLRLGITHEGTNQLLVIILPMYGLVAGLSISVYRAVCQRTLLLLSGIFNRELSSLDAWALAMIGSLVMNPYHLFEVAFQLSYSLSGLFIIMGQQEWLKKLTVLVQGLIFSSLSFLVSIPILSYHFYEIPWVTIITNFLFVPFFSLFLFPGLVILFLMSFLLSKTTIFRFSNQLLAAVLTGLESFLFEVSNRFDFSFVIGRLPHLVLLVVIICIISLLKKIEQYKRPSVFVVLLFFLAVFWQRISPVGYVLMLDVGQGDSIVIKEPGTDKVTLIDTGGEIPWQAKEKWRERERAFTIGKDMVVPSLKSLGIDTINRLYITHAHEDHMGELENIYQEMPIKEVAATPCTLSEPTVKKKLFALKESKIVEIHPAMQLAYPTMDTLALQPIRDYGSKNDQSLVLYVKIGKDNWLFTGDMEAKAEQDLMRAYPSLSIDYLKVGHHGSNTSSTKEFINHIQPETALVSVGQKNRYGHPSAEVLELFDEQKMITYLTAENGAIKVSYLKVPLLNKWITKIDTIK